MNKRKMKIRTCIDCGKQEEVRADSKTERCKECQIKKRTDVSKTTCPECGGKKSYKAKVCQKCRRQDGAHNGMYGKPNKPTKEAIEKRSGKNHWNWKGGVTKQRSGKQIAWSREVRDMYDNICDCCGYDREYALEAHHYKFSEGKGCDDFNIDNGVALCSNCHKEFHKRFGYGDNSKEQYLEFRNGFKNKESEVA